MTNKTHMCFGWPAWLASGFPGILAQFNFLVLTVAIWMQLHV